MLSFLVFFLVILIVLALAWWIIGQLPLPPPFHWIAQVVVVAIAAIALIWLLLGLIGQAPSVNLH